MQNHLEYSAGNLLSLMVSDPKPMKENLSEEKKRFSDSFLITVSIREGSFLPFGYAFI